MGAETGLKLPAEGAARGSRTWKYDGIDAFSAILQGSDGQDDAPALIRTSFIDFRKRHSDRIGTAGCNPPSSSEALNLVCADIDKLRRMVARTPFATRTPWVWTRQTLGVCPWGSAQGPFRERARCPRQSGTVPGLRRITGIARTQQNNLDAHSVSTVHIPIFDSYSNSI
jgi:hypothetical protein